MDITTFESPHRTKTCEGSIIGELYTGKTEDEVRADQIRQKLNLTKEQLSNEQALTLEKQLEYLLNGWLDNFERNLFNGKTLVEVIHTE